MVYLLNANVWTDVTWNPGTGCSKVSANCKFCNLGVN